MAQHLNAILKKYSDVISGKLPASEVSSLKTGDNPGVDYASKMPDEREFVASHSVEKHPDRNGNGPEVFQASKVKRAELGRHGHVPSPKDIKVYKQANEEVEELDEKYKVGDTVKPNTGPHKGVPHKVIHIHDDGRMNIRPDVHPSRNQYRGGAVSVSQEQLMKEELELDETSGMRASEYNKKAEQDILARTIHDEPSETRNRKIVNRAAGIERANKIIQKKRIANKIAAQKKKLGEAKDESEYGYEGDMAINQLKTICRHAEHLMKMLKPDTDLPEWVQAKIIKAEDYISTAHDYLMSEMNEEVEIEEAKMCESCGKSPCQCDTDDEMQKNKKGKKLLLGAKKAIQEMAVSQNQQKLMAMALAYKRGDMPEASAAVKKLASSMTEKQLRDYAETKRTGLPKKVTKESAPADTPITFPVTNSREGADRI